MTTSFTMFESKKNTQNSKRKSVKHTITRSLRRITGPFFSFFVTHRKKFAREARWENWKERVFYVLEFFHISNKSYVEEYEEYVTQYIKQSARQSNRTQRNNTNNNNNNTNSNSMNANGSSNSHDYYALLGVDRTASQEEIMRNFRVKIMKVHPDYYQ